MKNEKNVFGAQLKSSVGGWGKFSRINGAYAIHEESFFLRFHLFSPISPCPGYNSSYGESCWQFYCCSYGHWQVQTPCYLYAHSNNGAWRFLVRFTPSVVIAKHPQLMFCPMIGRGKMLLGKESSLMEWCMRIILLLEFELVGSSPSTTIPSLPILILLITPVTRYFPKDERWLPGILEYLSSFFPLAHRHL